MKKLFLVRHAKSSWTDMSLSDFDRPLNQRGKRDAPIMAEWLRERIGGIDALISSPAKRAKKTAKEFKSAFGIEVEYHKSLYHADMDEIYSSIYSIPEQVNSVAIFGHNPGFTFFANEFSGDDYIDNVPTCGIVGIKTSVQSWTDFSPENAELEFFMYPKKLNQT